MNPRLIAIFALIDKCTDDEKEAVCRYAFTGSQLLADKLLDEVIDEDDTRTNAWTVKDGKS